MKVASAKGKPELLKQIGETFGTIPGFERVSVNPATGSVVLHYDTIVTTNFTGGWNGIITRQASNVAVRPTQK